LRNTGGDLVTFQGAAPQWQGKLAVLIDRGTLGAAEVLATILHQKLEAELIGEPSFGFAGRVRRIPLNAGGALWLTDAFYTGPDREPLNDSLDPGIRVSSRRRPPATDEEGEEPQEDAAVREGVDLLRGPDAEGEGEEAERQVA
jgi:carboxyl-terminal processing protease